jgi:hypothetical protein
MISDQKLQSFIDRATQTDDPQSYECTDEIRVTGDALSRPIHWTGRQWAVTEYGVEARDGTYPIDYRRLWLSEGRHGWVEHMSEKDWVDVPDFVEALRLARKRWPRRSN